MPTLTATAAALLLLLLLSTTVITTSSTLSHRKHRRHLLHQPFFPPIDSSPPTQSPSPSPQPQPRPQLQPKLPSSSSSSSTPPKPFFPSYPSPPPPPSPIALATFPANISELLLPHPTSSSISHRHLVAIVASVTLLIAALLSAFAAFFYCRKGTYVTTTATATDKASHSDNLRLYPSNIATSDGSHKHPRSGPSNPSSEFLYLGTLADSSGINDEDEPISSNAGVSTSTQYQKLGSPELKPLPPLPKHSFKQRYGNSELGSSENRENDEGEEEEEFFSPRGSSSRKDSPVHIGSSPQRLFNSENFGSRSFNSRTASDPCSDSASPTNYFFNSASPALNLSTTSLKSKSPDFMIGFPAPVPARPIMTSMSSLSSCTSSSSSERGSWNTQNSPTRNSDVSEQSKRCPSRTDSVPIKLPPPPPPPPPPRFWEAPASQKQTRDPDLGPPVLVTPTGPVLLQNVATEQLQSNGTAERNEDTPRPKLKPLHWDKVRASSDRAMVWDQLKSSSFELNEEMIETLFMINNSNNTNMTLKDGGRRVILPSPNLENRVLDPKKSQNIAILLRALDVTIEEVCEALLEGN